MRLETTVGFEYEFSSRVDIRESIYGAMVEAGLPCGSPSAYRRSDGREWDIKTDSSCGWEIASPVLRTYEDLVKAAHVGHIIEAHGGAVNESCGFHVHVGLRELSEVQKENIFRFILRYEEAFFSLIPNYRRNTHWCKRLLPRSRDNIRMHHFARDGWWRDTWFDKNVWVNGQRYPDIGTLEFRIMPGTIDAKFVIGYVTFLQCMVKTVKDKKISWGMAKSSGPRPLFQTMLGQAGFYGPFTSEEQKELYVTGRKWAIERYTEAERYDTGRRADFVTSRLTPKVPGVSVECPWTQTQQPTHPRVQRRRRSPASESPNPDNQIGVFSPAGTHTGHIGSTGNTAVSNYETVVTSIGTTYVVRGE